jgi:hypothetical protein
MNASSRPGILFLLAALLLLASVPAHAQAARIVCISPAVARPGDTVTIDGNGFGAHNVQIEVGGVRATVLTANGHQVTFRVPDGVAPGSVLVTATNPGGRSGTIALRVIDGILLSGRANASAARALTSVPPVPVDGDAIDNGVILTRLAVRLTPNATVGQVNAALARVNGGIVTMEPGTLSIAVSVPRQPTVSGLERLASTLNRQPGIRLASLALEVSPQQLPFYDGTVDAVINDRFLLPSRFPAAWNAASLAIAQTDEGTLVCRQPRVPILIADFFGAEPPTGFSTGLPSVQAPARAARPLTPEDSRHGYIVALTAAGRLGANPFHECLDVRLVQSAGFFPDQDIISITRHMPAAPEKFIVNYSLGFRDECGGSRAGLPCQPPSDVMPSARTRAVHAMTWKEKTQARWPDFLMVVAGGNQRNDESAAIYPGVADAQFGSPMAIAAFPDPLFSFVESLSLWTPSAGFAAAGFESLGTTPADAAILAGDVQAKGLDGPDAVAPNVITVGSTTNRPASNVLTTAVSPEQLVESAFSDANPDVKAIGEQIFNDPTFTGTSLSAPQVTGLASYLWLLSPELRDLPPAITKRAIHDNARNGVIDAYAASLSLDGPGLPTAATAPVRLALLDVNNDDRFTEVDIEAFLRHLYFVDPVSNTITNALPSATDADFSRYDLNGDGFTTSGSRREQFDLDRVGSTQFGRSQLSPSGVTQDIEGQDVRFDETAVTDIEILCYYAYSDLYQGNSNARKTLLAGRCGLSIDPKTVTLRSGQTQQFIATSPGSGALAWSATAGTVSNTGLYTAAGPGTATIRVSSVANPAVFAEATVTITSGGGVRLVSRSCGTSVGIAANLVINAVAGKGCDAFLGGATTLYTVPAVTVNGTVTDQFTYLADYHETFSEAELLSDSVSSGGITIHDHVSSVKAPAGQTVTGAVLNSGSSSSFEFAPLEGTYRVTIEGQVSLTVPKFQIPARAIVSAVIEGEPVLPHCSLTQAVVDLRTCQLRPVEQDLFSAGVVPGTLYSQRFSFTADVSKFQRLAINAIVATAGVVTTTVAGDNDGQVSLNFTFERIQ